MPVPGQKPKIEPVAKVRIGEKRTSQKGKAYPAATDYFICAGVIDGKPKTLRLRFVHETVEEAFANGLEWWVKTAAMRTGALACYTKDGSADPTALRLEAYLSEGDVKRSEQKLGAGRFAIKCPARDCAILKRGDCKPMGRLVFVLVDDPQGRPLQIDTKSWNSLERLEGALRLAQERGPLNAPGRVFDLSVEIVKKGSDQFPVMSIQEATEEIVSVLPPADARAELIALIRSQGGDPKDPKTVEWIKTVGIESALAKLMARGATEVPS
jgi:hypothetical protein